MTLYTAEQALKAMEEVVNEYGDDFVYSTNEDGDCVYATEDGTPSCLVGHVIARLDPDAFDNVVTREQDIGSTSAYRLIEDNFIQRGFWDTDTGFIMTDAQGVQDNAGTWGEAYQAALLAAELRGVEVEHA